MNQLKATLSRLSGEKLKKRVSEIKVSLLKLFCRQKTPQHEPSDNLERLGWRQCSVFEGRDVPGLKSVIDGYKEDDIFIVLPYSCAVVATDFVKEPFIELFRMRRSDEKKRVLHHGRNPRNIQIELVENSKNVFLDGVIHDRFFVDHSLLVGNQPNQSLALAANHCLVVKNWFAKRYLRNAFPSAFNERARSALAKLTKVLKKSHDIDNLLAVYLSLDPREEELTDLSDPYDVEIVFLTTEAGLTDEGLIALKDDFRVWLDECAGLFVSGVHLRSDADVSLSEYRDFYRLDDYDFISYRDDQGTPEIVN